MSRPQDEGAAVPSGAKDAVFVSSVPLPTDSIPVSGFEFDHHQDHDVSVVDLVRGMSSMGFQASAIGDAVRIINDMVRRYKSHVPCMGNLNPF